jgi:PEP-CTERM motif
MKRLTLAAVSAVLMVVSAASAANADVIWAATGSFNDGGTLSGTFDINQYGFLDGYNLVTTSGSIDPGFTYTPADSFFSNGTFYIDAQPGYEADLHLTFTDNLSIGNASNPIIGGLGGPSWECDGSYSCFVPAGGQIRYLTSGSASDPVRVPEPLTLSLFGTGLAGAAAMRRRKKAKQA